VILLDVNILIYATIQNFRQHEAIHQWLAQQFNDGVRIGMPWFSLLGFLRVTTSTKAFPRPLTMDVAWGHVDSWLASEQVWLPQPTERHAEVLGRLFSQHAVRGNLVPDAHLAALAIEHGLTLCSIDEDFARFRELKWLNPLAP
jgi:uncharacterized protein